MQEFYREFSRRFQQYSMFHGHELSETMKKHITCDPNVVRVSCECSDCGAKLIGTVDKTTGKYEFTGGAMLAHCG